MLPIEVGTIQRNTKGKGTCIEFTKKKQSRKHDIALRYHPWPRTGGESSKRKVSVRVSQFFPSSSCSTPFRMYNLFVPPTLPKSPNSYDFWPRRLVLLSLRLSPLLPWICGVPFCGTMLPLTLRACFIMPSTHSILSSLKSIFLDLGPARPTSSPRQERRDESVDGVSEFSLLLVGVGEKFGMGGGASLVDKAARVGGLLGVVIGLAACVLLLTRLSRRLATLSGRLGDGSVAPTSRPSISNWPLLAVLRP